MKGVEKKIRGWLAGLGRKANQEGLGLSYEGHGKLLRASRAYSIRFALTLTSDIYLFLGEL